MLNHLKKGQKSTCAGTENGKKGCLGEVVDSSIRCFRPSIIHGHTLHDKIRPITVQFPSDNASAEEARVLREHFQCVMLCLKL